MDGDSMMTDSGMMMIGMGLIWLLIIVAPVLAIAALAKYLRSGPPK